MTKNATSSRFRHASGLPVVIAGAGPYGLSIAAHLDEAGIPFRIFGGAMQMWRERMPVGMTMKSDGFASNLSAGRDPQRAFTFRQFCADQGIPYTHRQHPMPLESFVAYGLEFQRRFVPHLDSRHLARVERTGPSEFNITLEDGEVIRGSQVICATGLMHFPHLPSQVAALPPDLVSHSSAHTSFARFAGQSVAVLGAGSSAMHTAALLNEAGARVTVIARRPHIVFHEAPSDKPRSLLQRLRHPSSRLGPGMRSWLSDTLPEAFHAMPAQLRHKIVQKHLGPSSSWHLKQRVTQHARLLLGSTIESTAAHDGQVVLNLSRNGEKEQVTVQHVVSATGYQVDVRRLNFLSPLQAELHVTNGSPDLDRCFESSVPGLFFVGVAAAPSFGPLLRFAAGSDFAAAVLTRTLRPRFKRSSGSFALIPSRRMPGAIGQRLNTQDDSSTS